MEPVSSQEIESVASLMARKDYVRAIPLLKSEMEKYPNNVRIRLQLADALAGAGQVDEALKRYEETSKYYDDNGLIVQAIAVRKKSEKLRQKDAPVVQPPPKAKQADRVLPRSPLFEKLAHAEREAVIGEMVLEQFDEGDIIITEGEAGSSLYVVVSGEVKVYTQGTRGEHVYLASLGEGDFFGEVSVLTGKPRTATITASQHSELLRLDKDKLDRVIVKHPNVRDTLDDFYKRRASQTVEAMIENLKKKG